MRTSPTKLFWLTFHSGKAYLLTRDRSKVVLHFNELSPVNKGLWRKGKTAFLRYDTVYKVNENQFSPDIYPSCFPQPLPHQLKTLKEQYSGKLLTARKQMKLWCIFNNPMQYEHYKHTHNQCNHPFHRGKCEEEHATVSCANKKRDNVKCVNCGVNHQASNHGCQISEGQKTMYLSTNNKYSVLCI